MKKYLWVVNTILFCSVFVILYIGVSYLFRPVSINRKNIVGYYQEPDNSLDVVLVGGSSTYVFWAPYDAWNYEGIVSYDFSSDSMSPALLIGMLEEAAKTQTPELYIVDLRALDVEDTHEGFYTDEYLRNDTDSMKYSLNRIRTINYAYEMEHPEIDDLLSQYFDLSMYHSNWQNLEEDNFDFRKNDKCNENKGFMFVEFAFHEQFERNDYEDVDYEVELSDKSDKILNDLLNYCDEKQLNVLFTLNPIYRDSAETKARYNYVGRIVNEHGYEFLDTNDYYDEMCIDFSHDFYNRDHVNYYGARKYTKFLAGYIKDNYNISDRRGDIKYQNWESGYPEWVERGNICLEKIDDFIAWEMSE